MLNLYLFGVLLLLSRSTVSGSAIDVNTIEPDLSPWKTTEETGASTVESPPEINQDVLEEMEADDMQNRGFFANRTVFNDTAPLEMPVVDFFDQPKPSNLKDDTEWLEEQDPDSVDVDLPKTHAFTQMSNERSWPWIIAMTALLAAIVLVVFIGITAYRYVTVKYSNRTVLINEEDMIDPNDMKHFTL